MATLGNYLIECLCFVNESTGRFGEMHLVCVRGASGTPHSYEWKAVRASWGGSWLGCTHHMDVLAHGHGVAASSLRQLAAGPWPAFSLALLSRRLGLPCCLSRAAPRDLFFHLLMAFLQVSGKTASLLLPLRSQRVYTH